MKISLKCLWLLASKIYKENKRRNLAIIIAISMATMFIVVVFSVTNSIQTMTFIQNLKVVGTRAEGMFYNLTAEEYDSLSQNPMFSDVSYSAFIGNVNVEKKGKTIEVRYIEEKAAEWCFSRLKEGQWAETSDEIVVDELFFAYTGEQYKIGDKLSLQLIIQGSNVEKEFIISGICESNKSSGISNLYISKSYLDEWLQIISEGVLQNQDISAAMRTMYCRFEYTNDSEEMMRNIWKQYYPEKTPDFRVNLAYGTEKTGATSIMIFVLIGVIVLCTYLTIYTVYYISATRDVQFYGQLKLIGLSNRQIGFLMKTQTFLQYVIAMPIGLLMGCGMGYVVLPLIISLAGYDSTAVFYMKWEHLLYAIGISLFCVVIGLRKPIKIISRISPIHTVGFAGIGKVKRKERKSSKVTLGQLALRNLQRYKHRMVLISASISVVLILFVCTSDMLSSVSLEGYMSFRKLPADFVIGTEKFVDEDLPMASVKRNISPLGDGSEPWIIENAILEDICKICPDEKIEPYYYLYNLHYNNSVTTERYINLYNAGKLVGDSYMIERLADYIKNDEKLLYWIEQRYYVDFETLERCKVVEGTLDKERFETGNYVVLIKSPYVADDGIIYHAGEKIELSEWVDGESFETLEDGTDQWLGEEKKEYEVMAVVDDVPLICVNFEAPIIAFLPSCRMPEGEVPPKLFAITLETDDVKVVEEVIDEYVGNRNGELSYLSQRVIKEELADVSNLIRLIGGGLAFIVALMAIVNFINHSMTMIIERREEFKTLRAIGMTKKQLIHMIRLENATIVGVSSLVGLIIGKVISNIGLKILCEEMYWLSYNQAVIPGVLLVVVLVVMAARYPGKRTIR